jgi:hypothetical protein
LAVVEQEAQAILELVLMVGIQYLAQSHQPVAVAVVLQTPEAH